MVHHTAQAIHRLTGLRVSRQVDGGDGMYSVLLVDDEPRAIEALELFVDWEAAGFKIIGSCEHGQEALERIVADQPDVVLPICECQLWTASS